MLGERVPQVWWWYLHWFRRYRKKTRGGLEIAPPPVGRGLGAARRLFILSEVPWSRCWCLRAMGNAEEGIVSASLLERGYGWRLCCQFLSHTITSYIFVTNISVEIAPSLRCSWFDHSWIPQLGTNISIFIVVETRITCDNTIQSGASPTGGGRPPLFENREARFSRNLDISVTFSRYVQFFSSIFQHFRNEVVQIWGETKFWDILRHTYT